jgi:hypothetical protein
VEVRLLVELRSLKALPGHIALRCTENSVSGEWLAGDLVQESRSFSRSEKDDAGELLLWLGSMLVEVHGDQKVTAPPDGSAPPASTANPQPSKAALATTDAAPPELTALTSVASPPQIAASAPPSAQSAARSAKRPPSSSHPGSTFRATPPWRYSGSLGLSYEHWGSSVPGAAGALLEGDLLHRSNLGGYVRGQAAVGLGDAYGFGAAHYSISLGAVWAPVSWLRLGAGPVVSLASASGPPEVSAPQGSGSWSFGGELAARFVWPPRGWGGFAMLGLRGLTESREFTLDNRTVLAFPNAQAFIALGVRWERAEDSPE